MTIICEEGNILAYSVVYFVMWRPWAPVHVIRRTTDGADMFSVGVDGVDGMRSHIVGAMSSKPGMASWGTFASTILLTTEGKRRDKRRYLNADTKKEVSILFTRSVPYGLSVNATGTDFFVNPAPFSKRGVVQ